MGEVRTDKFAVGDVVEWNTSIVMQHCRTWAPDITTPVTVIAVRSVDNEHLQRAGGHTQLVRIEPNYCPWGDEFSGTWFKPKSPPDARDATIFTLRAAVATARAALEPFVAKMQKVEDQYRKRGGDPDSFPNTHPSFDISADSRELPLGVWRCARSALAALNAVTPSKGE
jgi:hypothetical protein